MYRLEFLNKENDLNKIIKANKRAKKSISILFVSLWDEWSQALVESLKVKYTDTERGQPLYIVDSFYMPHSFVIYDTTKLPHLVHINAKGAHSEDYLPMIYKTLLPEKRRKKAS
jgi:hypothetical protein